MAKKTQELGRPEQIDTRLGAVQQTVGPATNKSLQMSESLTKFMNLAPKAQGLMQQLNTSKQIEQEKVNIQVQDLLKTTTVETLDTIEDPAIRGRVEGNLKANGQSQEMLVRVNNGEFDAGNWGDVLTEYNKNAELNLKNTDASVQLGFKNASDFSLNQLRQAFTSKKISYEQTQSTVTRDANMYNYTIASQDKTAEQIFKDFESGAFSKSMDIESGETTSVKYNNQQKNSAFYNSLRSMVAEGKDITTFLDAAKIERKDGNSLWSGNAFGYAQLEAANNKASNKKGTMDVQLKANMISNFNKEIDAHQLDFTNEKEMFGAKNLKDKNRKMFDQEIISESQFMANDKKINKNFEHQLSVNNVSTLYNLTQKQGDFKSRANLSAKVSDLKRTPEGQKVLKDMSRDQVETVLSGENGNASVALSKLQGQTDFTDGDYISLGRIYQNTGYVPEELKSHMSKTAGVPGYEKKVDLIIAAQKYGWLDGLGVSDDEVDAANVWMQNQINGVSKEQNIEMQKNIANKEWKNKVLPVNTINEVSKLAAVASSEMDIPGILGIKSSEYGTLGFLSDENIEDSFELQYDIEERAKTYIKMDPSTSPEDAVYKARNATLGKSWTIVPSGKTNYFGLSDQQRAVKVKSGINAPNFTTGSKILLENTEKRINSIESTNMRQLGIDSIGIKMDADFDITGEYILVDQDNRPLDGTTLKDDKGRTIPTRFNGEYVMKFFNAGGVVNQKLDALKAEKERKSASSKPKIGGGFLGQSSTDLIKNK